MTKNRPNTQLVWEAPPVPGHGYDWVDIARQLRARPTQWLKVFDDGPTSVVNAIRQSSVSALTPVARHGRPEGGFEVRTRNNKVGPPRTCTLYLRWVPDLVVVPAIEEE